MDLKLWGDITSTVKNVFSVLQNHAVVVSLCCTVEAFSKAILDLKSR
jgi:uncharacterized metal-binding protein